MLLLKNHIVREVVCFPIACHICGISDVVTASVHSEKSRLKKLILLLGITKKPFTSK